MDALKSAMHLRESELKVKYEEDLIAQEKVLQSVRFACLSADVVSGRKSSVCRGACWAYETNV